MRFNNKETEEGYAQLTPHMFEVTAFAKYYMKAKYGVEIMLTDTFRSQESQDYIYRNNERYKQKPWKSVHQYGRGADISLWVFRGEDKFLMTDAMSKDLTDTLNQIYYSEKYNTATRHDVGSGDHIHTQVPYERPRQREEG
jgi:hypothetical protein